MKKVRVGIVGAGLVSDSHAQGYLRHERAEIIAVCDINRDIAESKAEMWNAESIYTDYDEMLKNSGIEAVDIMTPPFMHHPMAIKAAESGKHINCEKPFCNSVKEGKEITDAAQRNNVVLAVDESYVFTSSHIKARALIDSGAIGEPRQIRHYKGSFVQKKEGLIDKRRLVKSRGGGKMWRADPIKSGGGLYPWIFDHAVHLFASTRYLMQDLDVESVFGLTATYSGRAGSDTYTAEDYSDIPIITWQFEDKQKQGLWVRAEKRAHDTYNNRTGFSTVVLGTDGMIEVLGEGGGGLIHKGNDAHLVIHRGNGQIEAMRFEEGGDRIWDSGISYYDQAHINEVTHFVDCIISGKKPAYGGEEGTREVRLTLAAIKSAMEGKPVKGVDVDDEFTAYD